MIPSRVPHLQKFSGVVSLALIIILVVSVPQLGGPATPARATTLVSLGVWSPTTGSNAVVDPSILAGITVPLKLNVTGSVPINGFDITIRWNPAVLAGQSLTNKSGIFARSDFQELSKVVASDHVEYAGVLLSTPVASNGTIFNFNVTVMGTSVASQISIDDTASTIDLGTRVIPHVSLNGYFSNTAGVGDLSVSSVSVPSEIVTLGLDVPITVGIRNQGTIPMSNVMITVYANNTQVNATSTPLNVLPNTQTSTTLSWKTTLYPAGAYNVTAVATTSSSDAFLGDNRLSLERIRLVTHDLKMVCCTVPNVMAVNSTVQVTAVVKNLGTIMDTANASIYANNTLIRVTTCTATCSNVSSFMVNPVQAGGTWTFHFQWNTTGLSAGSYLIEGRVAIVQGETDATNNIMDYGYVTIVKSIAHDLGVIGSVPASIRMGTNETLSFGVKNYGTSSDNFMFSIYFGNTTLLFRLNSAQALVTNASQSVSFVWDTLNYTSGIHSLTANVTIVGATDQIPDNNQFLGKTNIIEDKPPVAKFDPSAVGIQPGGTITFNATSSSDPDGTIKYYIWDFGDGTVGYGKVVSHTYSSPGTYNVKLTVWDDLGLKTTSAVQTISVATTPTPSNEASLLLYVGIIAVVVAAAVIGYVFWRRRSTIPASPASPKKP